MKKISRKWLAGAFGAALAVAAVAAVGASVALADQPIPTTTSLTLSSNPAADGDVVTITAHTVITSSGADVPDTPGSMRIQECIDNVTGNGVPAATCANPAVATWTNVATGSPATLVYMFDTTGLGGSTIGFRGHYVPSGGSGYHESKSPAIDLVILAEACTTGATIAADFASGDGNPPAGTEADWSFRITVHACENLTNVTAQGGTNGWAPATSPGVPSAGTADFRKEGKGAQIILWKIGNMTAGQTETLLVTVHGKIKPNTSSGTTLFLSGPWSTTYTNGDGDTLKSDYTGRVSIEVL